MSLRRTSGNIFEVAFSFRLKSLMTYRVKRGPHRRNSQFYAKVYNHTFGGWIEETMEYGDEYIDDLIENQIIQSTPSVLAIDENIPSFSSVPPTKTKVEALIKNIMKKQIK